MIEDTSHQPNSEPVRHLAGLNIYWTEASETQAIKILEVYNSDSPVMVDSFIKFYTFFQENWVLSTWFPLKKWESLDYASVLEEFMRGSQFRKKGKRRIDQML